jgi:hypothetical protein
VEATTWKDTIADTSNLWLNATRSEEDGRFAEATVFYLRDAAACLDGHLEVRAALSCSCAASCLEKTGNFNAARNLYFEAAKIYEEQAAAAFRTSLREALWLLQEAHDYFIIGGDGGKAAQIYDQCASLARKSSPFVTSETLDQVLRIRRGAAPRPVPPPPPKTSPPRSSPASDLRRKRRDRGVPAPQGRAVPKVRRAAGRGATIFIVSSGS